MSKLRDTAASTRDAPRFEVVGGQEADLPFSPYRVFTREQWAKLRADTPMTLAPHELEVLSGILEELSVEEVETIYLPLSRLLNLYVAAAQKLHAVSSTFLGRTDQKVPFIIGVSDRFVPFGDMDIPQTPFPGHRAFAEGFVAAAAVRGGSTDRRTRTARSERMAKPPWPLGRRADDHTGGPAAARAVARN